MFQKKYQFGDTTSIDAVSVSKDCLYSFDKGYGFLTEKNCTENELLQIPELNNGFEAWYWYIGQSLIKIKQDKIGCFINQKENIPLSFKANVPCCGNYKITITIKATKEPINGLMIFTGRRQLAICNKCMKPFESMTFETVVNVCDYIPRGKEVPYTDHFVCITVIGNHARISTIKMEEINTPTIYIAGDSTVADQTGSYPYIPQNCYCGWGQFLSFFLNNRIAVSNHAHSGLTTESFRTEGHYTIIKKHIKPGDFFLLQFGHNDQKLNHLTAKGGYQENVLTYIHEMKEKMAIPILVTPLCRNSWKGLDGTYHDLLADYDKIIHQIGLKEQVPVINLHKKSYEFITQSGLELSKRYFFPGDYTHTNDFGGYKMAKFIAEEFHFIHKLKNYPITNTKEWQPPQKIELVKPPKEFKQIKPPAMVSHSVSFTDIDSCENKDQIIELTSIGIIPNTETLFRPSDLITRVEALVMVIKVSNFFPTNVYNDRFKDIVGHEWYAGTIECAWSNGIIDKALVDDNFYPNKTVSYEEMISFVINGYKSRKTIPTSKRAVKYDCSDWFVPYYIDADTIKILDTSISSSHQLARAEAVNIIYTFHTMLT